MYPRKGDPEAAPSPETASLALRGEGGPAAGRGGRVFRGLLPKANEPMRLSDEAGALLQAFGKLTFKDIQGATTVT